jgi:hypothetical protein
LFINGPDKLPSLTKKQHQAHCLNELGSAYSVSGQPHQATTVFQNAINLEEQIGVMRNVVTALENLAQTQIATGSLKTAENHLRKAILLANENNDKEKEGYGCYTLIQILDYGGRWKEAQSIHNRGVDLAKQSDDTNLEFVLMINSINRALFQKDYSTALREAMIWEEFAKNNSPGFQVEFFLAKSKAHRANGDQMYVEANLFIANNICRQINLVVREADILLEFARLRYNQKNYEEAKSLADEALLITERCGYVLQGADVNLFLAQYALEQENDKAKAKAYAEGALKLATCDGPPYYYKVAYEEAEKMLASLKV